MLDIITAYLGLSIEPDALLIELGWPENSHGWAGSGCWKSCPPFHSGPIFSFEVVRGPTR